MSRGGGIIGIGCCSDLMHSLNLATRTALGISVSVIVAGGALWLITRGPFHEEYLYDDWDGVSTTKADHWRFGTFLGVPADRIRHVGLYRVVKLDAKSVEFFVAIPMEQGEFERRLREWYSQP